MNRTSGSDRRTARAAGILILGGYFSYGLGSSIVTAVTAEAGRTPDVANAATISLGTLLMLVNSALVIGIGVILYPILKQHSPRIALGYVATRLFEGILMAFGIASLLVLVALDSGTDAAADTGTLATLLVTSNLVAYNIAMLGLSVGSLFLCHLLFTSRLVPRFLGVWGFVGYAVFALGCLLEILGFTGAGLIATIPGGLWEVFTAVWLIVRGFNVAALTVAPVQAPPARSQRVHS